MIETMKQPYKKEEVENILNPLVKKWFFTRFKEFSLPQLFGVMEIHNRSNILVSAPTGATKTLTAFLAILNELVDNAEKGILEEKTYCIYISPLKALNSDIAVNLITPLREIEEIAGKKLGIRVAVRTGDTTASEKQKMLKHPPHILITTPESLAIVLSSIKFVHHLKDIQWCIIDEIHALVDNKRGVHLSLSVERLARTASHMTRVGLSATVAPIEEIAKFLVGFKDEKLNSCKIVDTQFIKELDLKVLSPLKDLIGSGPGEIHEAMYNLIDELIQTHKTTLIFTNTRAATERVVDHLKNKFPKRYTENIAAHHGSLSKDHRLGVESRLREGKLKCVVCSTSLELGIDIGYIDLVILLSSPKSVARALQRCLTYDSKILCADGQYRLIGDIVEKRLPVNVISYDKEKGFVENKIRLRHYNGNKRVLKIKLDCGEEIECTEEHPILTNKGWIKAGKIKKNDFIAELRYPLKFKNKEPYLFELLPKDKIFVANEDNFFQKIIDDYRKKKKLNAVQFVKDFGMPYSRFIDCRRLKGRKKSIRLDYFLKACDICNISKEECLPHLRYLKSKGAKWPELPLNLTKELMWLAGIIATDGCIVRSKKEGESEYYKIKIGNKSEIMINKIIEIVNKIEIEPYITLQEGFCRIEFGSNLLAYLFMSLGIPCKNKSFNMEISEVVYSLPNELLHAYLEGIFEGDGNLSIKQGENRGMIRIFTASNKFASGLHLIISRLGYTNKIKKSRIKASKLIKKVSDGDMYCIGIYRKEDLRRFFENIPGYGEKAIKGKKLTSNYKPYLSLKEGFNQFLSYSEVESVEEKGVKKVYNLTLENNPNNFIVGNVIAHNCGRSGHKLHEKAKGRLIVLDRDDLVECSVLLKSAIEKKIDKLHIPTNCLDVLAQQIVGIALESKISIEELYKLIKQSYCYQTLPKKDFIQIIEYLAGKYTNLEDRHIYAKIWYDEETGMIGRKGKMTRVIYMTNIGTIPDESFITIKIGEQTIGKLDESFVERLKPGDVFVLGGDTYTFKFSRGMVAQVAASSQRPPTVPSWFSEQLPLSFDLANDIGKFRRLLNEKFCSKKSKEEIINFILEYVYVDKKAAEAIYQYFYEQFNFSEIPSNTLLLVEHTKDVRGNVIVFHTLFGRRVNDCLSRAVAFAIAKTQHRDVEIGINDNGFYLRSEKTIDVMSSFKRIKSNELRQVMEFAIEQSEVMKRRFRHCAARALMILRNYKGRQARVGRQQVSSMILISALKRIDPNFAILKEAKREVLEDLMDIENTKLILEGIEKSKIKLKETYTDMPSPFAFNLVVQGYTDILKIEDKIEFLKRLHQNVLAKLSLKKNIDKDILNEIPQAKEYDEILENLEKKELSEKEKQIKELKEMAWNLKRVPMFAKEEIIRLIDGEKHIRPDVKSSISKYKDEIKKTWPKELQDFIFKKLEEID
jgi:Lhr-like helicase